MPSKEDQSRLRGYCLRAPEKAPVCRREAWESTQGWTFQDGAWRIQQPGRLITAFMSSNRLKLEFEAKFSPPSELGIYLGFSHDPRMKLDGLRNPQYGGNWKSQYGAYYFRCGQGRGDYYSIESLGKRGGRIFCERWEPEIKAADPHLFTLEFDEGELRLSADGKEIMSGYDEYPQALLSALSFQVEGPVKIRPFSLTLTPARWERERPTVRPEDFKFHVAIDFPDDLVLAEADWDEETLRELVRAYAAMGISRLYWIDYLGGNGGIIGEGSETIFSFGRVKRFMEAVPEPVKVLSEECHRHGMEAYAILKLFDMAYGTPWALAPESQPVPHGLRTVGGWARTASHFIRENPEKRVRLHPSLLPASVPDVIKEITLCHWDDSPLGLAAHDFVFWTSDDNGSYASYDGPLNFEEKVVGKKPERFAPAPTKSRGSSRPCRVYCFSGLNIRSRYLAVELRAESARAELENFLSAFVEVKDDRGERVSTTYGLAPSLRFDPAAFSYRIGDFRKVGIAFDAGKRTRYDRWTSGARLQQSLGRCRFTLRPGEWLGLAVGRNEFPTATVDPCYPEVRRWITDRARKLMELGADGVAVRTVNHTDCLDWDNYGFSGPVVEEFKRRHGVDITRRTFDRPAWRKLRGEYFDSLIRELSKVVREYDGSLQMHIDPFMAFGPESNCFLETAWNWKTWMREGLVDAITLKEGPETFSAFEENTFWDAVARAAWEKGIPVYTCNRNMLETAERPLAWYQKSRQAGLSGIIFYESANLVHLQADGKFNLRCKSLPLAPGQFTPMFQKIEK